MRLTRLFATIAAMMGMGASLPPGAARAVQRREQPPCSPQVAQRGFWHVEDLLPCPNDPILREQCRAERRERKTRNWWHRHCSQRALEGKVRESTLLLEWQDRRDTRAAA